MIAIYSCSRQKKEFVTCASHPIQSKSTYCYNNNYSRDHAFTKVLYTTRIHAAEHRNSANNTTGSNPFFLSHIN
jgi:hypothetical protein